MWAEKSNIDGRGINFCLANPEIFDKKGNVQAVNPRNMTTFLNTISGLDNWNDNKSLAFILNVAKGCFLSDENIVGNMFTTFIANKYDKLLTPDEILHEKWNTLENKLKKCIYTEDVANPVVQSILATRFLNSIFKYYNTPKYKSDIVNNRILEIVESEHNLLAEDNIFYIIRELVTKFPKQSQKLVLNVKLMDKVLM